MPRINYIKFDLEGYFFVHPETSGHVGPCKTKKGAERALRLEERAMKKREIYKRELEEKIKLMTIERASI